jgi:WD40 repeat protein
MDFSCTFKQHIDSIDVASSGQHIAISTSSLEGNVWDGGILMLSADGSEILSKHSPAGISMVRFSGPKILLAARDDGNVVMYSSDKLEEMQVFEAHDDMVSSIVDDPHNESQFASVGWDGSIYIWDWKLRAERQIPILSYEKSHSSYVNDVKYSAFDPNNFTSVGRDGLLRVWDKRLAPSSGCAGIINVGQSCSCVSYDSMDQNVVLVGTDAGDITVIDFRGSGQSPLLSVNHVHKGRVRRIAQSPSATSGRFVSASDDSTYVISDRENAVIREIKR